MDMAKLNALLAEKPEMVSEFPSWLLPPDKREALRAAEGVVVAEIAGRDSIAAVLKAVEAHPIQAVLPTIAYTGTEYGSWQLPLEKTEYLTQRLAARGINAFPPLFLGSPRFWWLLCGRPLALSVEKFGLVAPCLGCHLYFHALRIPLAKEIGAKFIIAGERESHDGRVKLNQVGAALDAYVEFVRSFDQELLLPLRHISDGNEISGIIGEDWAEGREQLGCVLSKNYQDEDGNVFVDSDRIRRFFSEFAVPVAHKVVQTYLAGETLGSWLDLS
jgi:hypothetical protein